MLGTKRWGSKYSKFPCQKFPKGKSDHSGPIALPEWPLSVSKCHYNSFWEFLKRKFWTDSLFLLVFKNKMVRLKWEDKICTNFPVIFILVFCYSRLCCHCFCFSDYLNQLYICICCQNWIDKYQSIKFNCLFLKPTNWMWRDYSICPYLVVSSSTFFFLSVECPTVLSKIIQADISFFFVVSQEVYVIALLSHLIPITIVFLRIGRCY